jgi:3-beta hydroxysteroid dehydrogenase/isomerase family protein
VTLVDGDVRDAKLVREVMEGIDIVFHEAAIRITQCAEDPRLAHEVLATGTFNILEAAVAAKVRRVVLCFIRFHLRSGRRISGWRSGRRFPYNQAIVHGPCVQRAFPGSYRFA